VNGTGNGTSDGLHARPRSGAGRQAGVGCRVPGPRCPVSGVELEGETEQPGNGQLPVEDEDRVYRKKRGCVL